MLKALIVEDNDTFRQILCEELNHRFPSLAIEEAADAEEAMKKVHRFRPHLIFMDIKLPGINGLEATNRIKEIYPHIVIIIITSYDLPEYREAAKQNGANYFMVKGSSSSTEILALVDSILSELGSDKGPS